MKAALWRGFVWGLVLWLMAVAYLVPAYLYANQPHNIVFQP